MGRLEQFSTETASVSERIGLYQSTVHELFGGLEARIVNGRTFAADFEYASIGDLGICKYRASAHQVERTSALARRNERGSLKLALQIRGTSYCEQAGRGLSLSPGQWGAWDTAKPYKVVMPEDVELLLVMLPREEANSNRYNLDDLMVRRFSGTTGAGKLAYQFICSALEELPHVDSGAEPDIVDTIGHLVRLTMLEYSGQHETPALAILNERIKSYVLEHLRDPSLSVEQIAAALKCSKRYLHKALELNSISLSDYIRGSRLDRCRSELLNRAATDRSITEIAFSWGFRSSAHFSTAFKKHFGVSPRDYRTKQIATLIEKDQATARGRIL